MFWILQKSSRKLFPIWFLIRNIQTNRLKLSVLRVFKTPEIASIVEFFFQKQALTMSLQNNCSKQQQILSVNLAIVFEKDFTVDVWLHKQHQKRKIKALKDKKNSNADANAEMPLPRFPNGPEKFRRGVLFIQTWKEHIALHQVILVVKTKVFSVRTL